MSPLVPNRMRRRSRILTCLALLTVPGLGCGSRPCVPAEAAAAAAAGWEALRSGDAEKARRHFSSGVRLCPDHLSSVVGTGYSDLRLGNEERARRRFERALELNPRSVDALAGLGHVAWRDGDLEEVSRRFLAVLALDPDHAEALDYLARLPEGLGPPPDRPPLVLPDTVTAVARARGDFLEVRTPGGWRPFYVRGVNLGAALPGRHASQFPDSATYARWIEEMADMRANAVRVYTIHPPHFYSALARHNRANPEQPLLLIHGVWTELPPGHDFDDREWYGAFTAEMERAVDVIHGRADLPPRPGHASGFYTADVSPWTMAWIIGREWEPFAIVEYNKLRKGRTSFAGEYLAVERGRPADVWMAKAMEHMVAYETATYRTQRPIAYTNWPTLDPLRHPTETTVEEELAIRRALGERIRKKPLEYDNDATGLDATLIQATARFPAGHFASYHAYPYYPDLVMVGPEVATAASSLGPSTYFGYLRLLKAHHPDMPVVISEYGVPTGFGFAHLQPQGFHHGGLSEERMAEVDARLTLEIAEAGMAGGAVFAWMDEWFKKNWVTIDFELPPDRNRLWHNRLDAEQHYGMIAYAAVPAIPGETAAVRRDAWDAADPLLTTDTATVRAAADAAYLWLLVDPPAGADSAVVGFDMLGPAGTGNRRLPHVADRYAAGFEFALHLTDDGVRLAAAPGYNPFRIVPVKGRRTADSVVEMPVADPPPWLFRGRWEMELNRPVRPDPGSDAEYEPLLVIPNRRRFGRDGTEFLAIGYDRGILPRGEEPDGLWVRRPDGAWEVRIPWGLLNVTDPSSRRVVLDRKQTGEIGTTVVESIGLAGAFPPAAPSAAGWGPWPESGEPVRFTWETWDEPRWRARVRPVYRAMRETFRTLEDR